MSLLIIPALGILVKENNQVNKITEKPKEVNIFCCAEKKEKVETNWNREPESKSGRQLTYFWAEHAYSQTN